MIAVIFELIPVEGKRQDYFDLAEGLAPLLEDVDGFLSIERFQSLKSKGKFLSLSLWRDENAIHEWRNQMEHRQAQRAGRDDILHAYRLRVANVIRDYTLEDRKDTPQDSSAFHS